MKITKPLPAWAIQLVYFLYSFLFVGAGYAYVQTKNENLASMLAVLAPLIHGLLVLFVGEDPKEKK